MSAQPIRLALIGAGIFARTAHVPALLALPDRFTIAAVCSRRRSSAEALAADLPYPVEVCDDIDSLLARDDIEAVDLVLPIPILPDLIAAALRAGKHVISEKPATPDVATGQRLLDLFAQHSDQVWMVAENWRYEPAVVQAAQLVQMGEIGRPLVCHWAIHSDMTSDNPYYATAWRHEEEFPGGFLLDGGVHHIAALRLILGEIDAVSAISARNRPDLPPVDTLSATLRFENGAIGTHLVSYAAPAPWDSALHIVGDHGALRLHRGELSVTRAGRTDVIDLPDTSGIQLELAAFAAAVRDHQPHANTPHEGVQDVAVIEALMRAAESGERVSPARVTIP